ncbi:hypothetical protein ACVIGB_007980 [Bradyrhizobium sp. USDA 4341]
MLRGLEHPREIVLARGIAGQIGQIAVGVTGARRLDLDDVGAEVGQHGGGRGRRDEARAVQDLEPVKNAFFHRAVAPVALVGVFPVAGIIVCDDPDRTAI